MIHTCTRCGIEFEYSGFVSRCNKCRVTCEKCGNPVKDRGNLCGSCRTYSPRKMVKCLFDGCENEIRYDKHRAGYCREHTDWSNHAKRISEYNRSNKGKTSIEIAIENELKNSGEVFIDQFTLLDGLTVVDFFIPSKKIVIYCDGDYWHGKEKVANRDEKQNEALRRNGYKVFRFSEKDIKKSPAECVARIYNG